MTDFSKISGNQPKVCAVYFDENGRKLWLALPDIFENLIAKSDFF